MALFSHLLVRAYGDGVPNPQYTTATLTTTFDNPNADTQSTADQFGYSIAASGPRVMIGARDEDAPSFTDTGKAYAFNGSTTPTYQFDNPSDGTPDNFGASVAIQNSTYVIGAPGDDDPESDSGKVYLYDVQGAWDRGEGTPTTPIYTFINPNRNAANVTQGAGTYSGDQFGFSVSISGDYIVAGAPYEDAGAVDGGRAYVFDINTKNLIQTLTQPSPGNNEFFGWDVAIDGSKTVVGAKGRINDNGEVYVYDTTSGVLLHTLVNPNTDPGDAADNFGTSVAISGKYVIAGAPYEDDQPATEQHAGAAYVYDITSGTPTAVLHNLRNPDADGAGGTTATNDLFGSSVSVDGIYAAVGCPGQDSNTGVVYIYKLEENAFPTNPIEIITNPTVTSGDLFGHKVVISGSTVLIGAPGANKVYQYTLS